jgi:phage shock protein A
LPGCSACFSGNLPLIEQNQRYRKHILSLDMKIQEQEGIARQLKQSIDAVQNDPRTLERLRANASATPAPTKWSSASKRAATGATRASARPHTVMISFSLCCKWASSFAM